MENRALNSTANNIRVFFDCAVSVLRPSTKSRLLVDSACNVALFTELRIVIELIEFLISRTNKLLFSSVEQYGIHA